MNDITNKIRNCKKGCFTNRYTDYHNISQNEYITIKPFVHIPLKPTILLVSQAPSFHSWKNGITSADADGGMTNENNSFLIKDLLPSFGLSKNDLVIFKEKVLWIHCCNCYPWFYEKKQIRHDKSPTIDETKNCLGQWLDEIVKIESIKNIVLMGKCSFSFFKTKFPEINNNKLSFIELIKLKNIRTDIIKGKNILPIFHQSKKSRVFNDHELLKVNDEIKLLLNKMISSKVFK